MSKKIQDMAVFKSMPLRCYGNESFISLINKLLSADILKERSPKTIKYNYREDKDFADNFNKGLESFSFKKELLLPDKRLHLTLDLSVHSMSSCKLVYDTGGRVIRSNMSGDHSYHFYVATYIPNIISFDKAVNTLNQDGKKKLIYNLDLFRQIDSLKV